MTVLQDLIARRELDLPPGFDEPCEGSKFHSPTPLLTLCVDLADMQVKTTDDAKDPVRLCGVCSTNLEVFLLLAAGEFPWEAQRQFGNSIRALAKKVMAHEGER